MRPMRSTEGQEDTAVIDRDTEDELVRERNNWHSGAYLQMLTRPWGIINQIHGQLCVR